MLSRPDVSSERGGQSGPRKHGARHDLIGVGLIESSWLVKLPPELAERLKQILDTPDA